MKYGKEFQQLLDGSDFPDDWKSSAIEYRQLKKIIKDVVAELTSMGLSPDVLHKLLLTEETDPSALPAPALTNGESGALERRASLGDAGDNDEVLEFEFESDEGSPASLRSGNTPPAPPHPHSPKEVIVHPVQDGDSDPTPSTLSLDTAASLHPHRKFRLRLLSETSQVSEASTEGDDRPKRPLSVADMIAAQEQGGGSETSSQSGTGECAGPHRGRKVVRTVVADGHGGVKAEYVLTGDPEHPVPQLRLHLKPPSPSPERSTPSPSPSPPPSSIAESETDDETEDEDDAEPASMATPRPFDRLRSPVLPSSPTLNRMRAARSPIWAIASGGPEVSDGMHDLSLGDAAVGMAEPPELLTPRLSTGPSASPTPPPLGEDIPEISTSLISTSPPAEREFIIPLSSDLAFFSLLTTALTSLSAFHSRQQTAFRESVDRLCGMISHSISPQADIDVRHVSFTSSPNTPPSSSPTPPPRLHASSSKASKKDLYAWREIFTLWIEAEIFESTAERDRGERTVEQAEVRLQKFAGEVVKRGLGDRRTMKGRKVREAWEEFLRLNVLLLDLKRFQQANINAARKILKKHDKRTALTASAGFPSFVRSTLSAHVDKDGNVSTWTFYNTSLPHVLLASLTSTLLPILPSLDDYACLICTSIAFKPIRLACGHLFCVRCLVKMQKAGKAECPLCRSKVVLLADKSSLDMTVMNFMKEWFPKEVKAKQKENEAEVNKEMAMEAGVDTRCVIM
ncbi:hypothetical protein IAT38_001871 [Cryptococcus sp. DSM 104549]